MTGIEYVLNGLYDQIKDLKKQNATLERQLTQLEKETRKRRWSYTMDDCFDLRITFEVLDINGCVHLAGWKYNKQGLNDKLAVTNGISYSYANLITSSCDLIAWRTKD